MEPRCATCPALFLVVFSALILILAPSAYADVNYTPSDSFVIPDHNSRINFASSGSFTEAKLENNFWFFYTNPDGLLQVSAQNCNVTITRFNFLVLPPDSGWLQYYVTGKGSQSFSLNYLGNGVPATCAVYIDGVLKARNDGWTITDYIPFPNRLVTVTGASSKVSIYYAMNIVTAPPEPSLSPSPSQGPSPTPSPSPPQQPTLSPAPSLTQQSVTSPSSDSSAVPSTTPASKPENVQSSRSAYGTALMAAVLAAFASLSTAIVIIEWKYAKRKSLTL